MVFNVAKIATSARSLTISLTKSLRVAGPIVCIITALYSSSVGVSVFLYFNNASDFTMLNFVIYCMLQYYSLCRCMFLTIHLYLILCHIFTMTRY